jgi:hypothetical protein
MKNVVSSILFFALFLVFACEPATSNTEETTEETTVEEVATEEVTSTLATGDNFTTQLLEGGIPSPRKEMTGTIGDVKVTVNYGSPSVKGRAIWGELVGYDKVWRSGANAATTIEFSQDVKVEGKAIKAGKYVLLTMPSEKSVEVMFMSDMEQNAFNFDKKKVTASVKVMPTMLTESVEELQYILTDEAVVLQWEKWSIPFKVTK